MSDPSSSSSHSRLSVVNPSSIYTFSHIFPPSAQQSDFFAKTTLPLVKDVLEGQSGLLFTYGVTNSGKTYTIQGESGEVRLQGIEAASPESPTSSPPSHLANKFSLADALDDPLSTETDTDPTTLKLDRNHEYTIWLSYSEVYNEKVYDLFASVDDPSFLTPSNSQPSGIPRPRPTSTFLNLPVPSSQSKPLLLTRKALSVKPCPPSDSDSSGDPGSAGKYVAGLRQLRVTTATQAKALLKLGQMHRRVFGTLANSQSSRSHALVTIKVLRVHRGERNDPTSIQTSRLTLVDLAGSERMKHTHTSGDRLREAGSINKSLMVLGQCMETMRCNQRALARSLAGANAVGRMDTRDVRKGLAVVPFRHSKLTEVLMDYFVGEGRAVMIVNVNPYDTGYDENSHVMKFAALAREVCTTAPAPVARALPVAASRSKSTVSGSTARNSDVVPHRRKVTISMGRPGQRVTEALLEVLEEDEEREDGESDEDEPINPLVDALFDEIESLRLQLFESEMRSAIIEAETREEVMQEMEGRMLQIEKTYRRRLEKEQEQNEMKMDAKIDMIQRVGLLSGGNRNRGFGCPSKDDEDDELDDIEEEDEQNDGSDEDSSPSQSPLAAKTFRAPMYPLSQTDSERDSADSDHTDEIKSSHVTEEGDNPSSVDDWPANRGQNSPYSRASGSHIFVPPSPVFEADVKAAQAKAAKGIKPMKMSQLAQPPRISRTKDGSRTAFASLLEKTESLSLQPQGEPLSRDSIVVIPNRKAREEAVAHGGPNVEYVPKDGEVDTVKKKKRSVILTCS
ncbi:hypothetical protein PHLCEN_2v6617 [Hermanssonia centrifuga]|uniref:Kinesin-like protein n=1 Tax=Hermanssonia centrifuga TaxID=98765 RepID=A0A2R6NYR4_9APHY|nr:hypothetical protein PHLCEN_2v6617 [Hermanssonia centrifuga]